MKSKTLGIILVLLESGSACTQSRPPGTPIPDEAWSAFAHPECRCSVEFPGLPSLTPSKHGMSYRLDRDGISFGVGWSDTPAVLGRAELVLVPQAMAANAGVPSLPVREADVSGFPGVQADWSAAGQTTEMREVAVGGRVYLLSVIASDRAFDRKASARFLASFRLADPDGERQRAAASLLQQQTRRDRVGTAADEAIARAREAPAEPTLLEPPGEGFRALMPAGVESTPVDLGGVQAILHVSVGDSATCKVLSAPLQSEPREEARRMLLARTVDQIVASAGMTAASSKSMTRLGRPALVTKASSSDVRAEILATVGDDRLIVLIAMMATDDPAEEEARRFLDSFEVLPVTKSRQP